MASISIVIVNWNRCEDLLLLLADLASQIISADEIVVVDNGSNDGAPDLVAKNFPGIRLIRLPKNMGLSFGRNVGITAVKSDIIVFLDNDLRILDPTFLKRLLQSIHHHSDCGIISFACIQGLWSKPPANFPNLYNLTELKTIASRGKIPTRGRAFYHWFFYGGACVIRKNVFIEVGLFDTFFSYGGEEWDFAYRCHAANIRLFYDEKLWVIHTRSPKMRSKATPRLILQNMIIAQARYMPLPDLILFLIMQFAKSALDALRGNTLRMFVLTWWHVIKNWQHQVIGKRCAVSRRIMYRFYYLRIYSPTDYALVEQSKINGIEFYQHQSRIHKTKYSDILFYALMVQ